MAASITEQPPCRWGFLHHQSSVVIWQHLKLDALRANGGPGLGQVMKLVAVISTHNLTFMILSNLADPQLNTVVFTTPKPWSIAFTTADNRYVQ